MLSASKASVFAWLDQALPDAWKLARKLLQRQDCGNCCGEDSLESLHVKYASCVPLHLMDLMLLGSLGFAGRLNCCLGPRSRRDLRLDTFTG